MATSTSADAATPPSVPPSAPSASAAKALAPLRGMELVAGTIALSTATFMVVLDTSIANVSIPAISGNLGVSTSQGTWVITSFAVANAIAVPLTGWLTQRFGSVRLFTLSTMLFVYATWMIYQDRESPTRKLPIDTIGLGLLVVWIAALQIMLDKGKELDWFGSTQIIVLAVIAVVGFVLFLIWELNEAHPVVDLRLFAGRNFSMGTLTISVGYGVFFGNVVLLPLWLQTQMGYTATDAGFVLAPVGILAVIMAPMVGRALARVDPRYIATFAFLMFALISSMRALFNVQVDMATLMVPTILQGAAVACFFIPLVSITLSGLPPDRIPSASGLSNFARITAGAFGTSISTTLWDDRATMHHAHLAESINVGNLAATQTLDSLKGLGLDPAQSLATVDRLINAQAYVLAADDIFYASAVIFLLLAPLLWMTRPRPGGMSDAGGAH